MIIEGKEVSETITRSSHYTRNQVKKNMLKHVMQDVETLILCMTEGLGEVARALLDIEGNERTIAKCRDLGALYIQLEVLLKNKNT